MKEDRINSILSQINRLRQQVEEWKNQSAVPEIEKDAALRAMQEIYAELKLLNQEIPAVTVPVIKQTAAGIIDVPPVAVKPEEKAMPAMDPETEKQQRLRAKTFVKQEQPVTLFDAVTEKPQQPEETLLDKLSKKKEEKSLADKLSSLPVGDLKKSIGINERFKFINELFESSTAEYNQFIDKLNACTTSDEAFKLMEEEYAAKRGWNKEEETYQSLTALIGRKFA